MKEERTEYMELTEGGKGCVAAIILNYNNWEDTLACLDSALKWNTAPMKYIVVDGGSTREGTQEALDEGLYRLFGTDYERVTDDGKAEERKLSLCTLLISQENGGYAKGNNKGARLAFSDPDVDYILILNNDTLFVQDIVPALTEAYNRLKDAAIVGPLLMKKDQKEPDYNCARRIETPLQHAYWMMFFYVDPLRKKKKWKRKMMILKDRPELMENSEVECDLLSGACFLVGKQLFRQMDGFDEGTFLYNEENILHKRIKARGLRTYVLPQLKLIHLGASSTSQKPGLFIMKCSRDSTLYYIDHYSEANKMEKMACHLAAKCMLPQVRLQKWMFKTFGMKKHHDKS